MGPIGYRTTSANKYHHTLHNTPDERRLNYIAAKPAIQQQMHLRRVAGHRAVR
jgi:hypothetical protein